MRIWQPAFWGVLVLLYRTSTSQNLNNDKNTRNFSITKIPDLTRPHLNKPVVFDHAEIHVQTSNDDNTSTISTTSGRPFHEQNLTTLTNNSRLNITHKLKGNNYNFHNENSSESFSYYNKNITHNTDSLSTTNNGNQTQFVPVNNVSKESVYLSIIETNNEHRNSLETLQNNSTGTNNFRTNFSKHSDTSVNFNNEKNKNDSLIKNKARNIPFGETFKVEHRQAPFTLSDFPADGTVVGSFSEVGASRSAIPMAREVEEAADYGIRMMNELVSVKEPQLYAMGLWLNRDDPAGKVAAFNEPNPEGVLLSRYGYASLQASTKLFEQLLLNLESRTTPFRIPADIRESLRATTLHRECPILDAPLPCRPAAKRYRTADGTCNNSERPRKGAALTPMQRFLPPQYHDGLQSPRRSVINSEPLPSPRLISTQIHRPQNVETPSVTHLLMQWGQFLDHDITSTPQSRAFNGSTPRCCENGGRGFLPRDLLHPECMPIEVPSNDWFYGQFGIRCMEFVRSAPTAREGCDFGHRQQMNQVTAYIDASTIYGSTVSQSDSIRLFRGGMIHYGRADPPNGGEPCRSGAVSVQCLRPGDGRASEQPGLTSLHIAFVRKHNTLATALTHLNPHWSDEKMFQETRRIVGAIMQHITYREFLPIILGHEVLKLFDLDLIRKGYYTDYDPRINSAISNGFSAAAYRFGHSLVQSSFVRSDRFHRPIFNNVTIHDEQSNENINNIWSPGSVDRILLGLANQPSQRRDEFISEELTNHLFQSPGFPFGMDLAAINIQRGRDHGLPSYTAWRQPCGLSPIQNWTDLQRVMSVETAERFRSIYLHVDDIDLYSAGLAERPVRGGLVGPTFACIIAQQFLNLRKGDRFWYENGNFESSFTPSQLQQIRKVTLAQIICETMTEVDTIQPFVFLTPDNFRNQRDICRNLIDFDLTPWIEKTPDIDPNKINKFTNNLHFTDNDVEMKSEKFIDNNKTHTNKGDEFNLHFTANTINNKNVTKKRTQEELHRTKRQTSNTSDNTTELNETTDKTKINNRTEPLLPSSKIEISLTAKPNLISKQLSDSSSTIELNMPLTPATLKNNITSKENTTKNINARLLRYSYDKIEHRQSDDISLPLTSKNYFNSRDLDNKSGHDLDLLRAERKRKQPTIRRKTKPVTSKSTIATTTSRPLKTKNINSDLKQITYIIPSHHTKPNDYESPDNYYDTYDVNGPSSSNPLLDEIIIASTKRPSNLLTHIFDSARRTTTTTTPKPDYQFHIQINYFYNTTTERSVRPTKPTKHKRPYNSYDRLDNFEHSKPTFIVNNPTPIPNNYNYNRPDYNPFELEDLNPLYSSSNIYNNNHDKINFGTSYVSTFTTTSRPTIVTKKQVSVVEIKPRPLPVAKQPNVYIVNEDKYDHSPIPNFNYNNFIKQQSYQTSRPAYDNKPNTIIYKRPITGSVTKLDAKPVVIYGPSGPHDNPNYFGTPTIYDYDVHIPNTDDTHYKQPYNSINDKLDFLTSHNNNNFVKISSTKKYLFTTPKPFYDEDKKYIRISTVKGHATSSDNLSPIYISVQNKEAQEDLEMTYDDLLEVYVKPDKDVLKNLNRTSENEQKTLTSEPNQKTQPTQNHKQDQSCSTELPRPMPLFIEDELLEF